MRWLALSVLLLAACRTEQPAVRPDEVDLPPPRPDAEVREAVQHFAQAVEQHDFAKARGLLCAPLRERYTAERLAVDFDAEPLAKERVARIRAALEQDFTVDGDHATLPLGPNRALHLVHEDDGWRLASLE